MKKISSILLTLVALLTLAACGPSSFTVTFVNEGGSDVESQTVAKGGFATNPGTPLNEGDLEFRGWFENLEAGSSFEFETTAINEDKTLYAKWVEKDKVILTFNTKVAGVTIPTQTIVKGEVTTKPNDPVREGYKFGGWFKGKAGLLWSEPNAFEFGAALNEDLTLHAYWEPLNSKAVNYTAGETYKASLSAAVSNLNPLTYTDGLVQDLFNMMSTNLYTTEVDWDKAIAEGVADYKGDFSKISAGDFSIEALDYRYVLLGAAKFPVDGAGEDYLDENGNYDRDAAAMSMASEWVFEIRQDLKFEDGTPIDSSTYEFALQQYLDPVQLNYRAPLYMESEGGTSGTPILNAKKYYEQKSAGKPAVAWSEVGFKVIDKYTFKIVTSKPISQADAVAFGSLKLLHPVNYMAGMSADKSRTNYGTIENPYVSYGQYILKTWDSGQKYVFNKNFDYVAKENTTYKAIEYQVVATEDDRMKFYNEGKLNVVGLGATYYPQFANSPDVYKTPSANLQNITFNLHPRGDGKATPEILKDVDFRWAMYYGFNRKAYNDTVYAPNSASINFLSVITKQFLLGDTYTYAESSAYLALVEKYELSKDTYGFVPEKAKELFNKAYAKLNNPGKIVLDMPYNNYEHIKRASEYIKSMYEDLFGKDRFEINLIPLADDPMDTALVQRNFDLNLNHVGYGVSYAAFFQIPGLFVDTANNEMGLPEGFGLETKEITVELPYLFAMLSDLDSADLTADDKAFLALFDGDATITTTAKSFYNDLLGGYARFWTSAAGYDGATEDLSNLTAAYEDLIWQYVPVIPVSSRGSATLFQDVHISWPAWSQLFDWGTQMYRYLTSDPDFQ